MDSTDNPHYEIDDFNFGNNTYGFATTVKERFPDSRIDIPDSAHARIEHMQCKMFLLPTLLATGLFAAGGGATQRLTNTAEVFQEIMQVADRAIPQKLLDKAECVVIVPGMKKGALIIGGKYGRGFVSCRRDGGGWGPPAGVRVEGGSFGFQIGGAETDVIMLVMNQKGVKRLSQSKFTLGADASVAAGPVGRQATAETDALMTAEILTWSRSRGVFAGLSLQGATLRPDRDVNLELYKQSWGIQEIVRSGLETPPAARGLLDLLNKYSSRKAG